MLNEKSSRVYIQSLSLEIVLSKGLFSLNPLIIDFQNKKKISLRSISLSIMNKHNYFFNKKIKIKKIIDFFIILINLASL